MTRSENKVTAQPDYERDWQEFWASIVAPNGVLDLEQVKKELRDFHFMMTNTATVFDAVTEGRISKPMTLAREVIQVAAEVSRKEADYYCDEGECKCAQARLSDGTQSKQEGRK